MLKLLVLMVRVVAPIFRAELATKRYLNLAARKTMVAGAEIEAQSRHAEITLCLVEESGNLFLLQNADAAAIPTRPWAQNKARHTPFYRTPTEDGARTRQQGSIDVLAFPDYFPPLGELPILVDGQIIGGIAASGRKPEFDEAVVQAGLEPLFDKK